MRSKDGDDRLALQGLDRVRAALELNMRAIGPLQADGGVTVNVAIDNRRNARRAFDQTF